MHEKKLGLVLVSPLVLYIFIFLGFPFVQAVWLSLNHYLIGMQPRFVGLSNYSAMIRNPNFGRVVGNTLVYTCCAVTIKLLIGLSMALLLNQNFRGRNLFRGFFLFPWVFPNVAALLSWKWFYDYHSGLINLLLVGSGLLHEGVPWLATSTTAMTAVVAANVWRGFPFFGISLLAGLQTIPKELYAAARIDGAGVFGSFRYITLPGLSKVIGILIMLSTIWTFNDFETVFLLTQGGPGYATMTMAPFSYMIGILGLDLANAIVVSLLVVPILAVFIFVLSKYMLEKGDK